MYLHRFLGKGHALQALLQVAVSPTLQPVHIVVLLEKRTTAEYLKCFDRCY